MKKTVNIGILGFGTVGSGVCSVILNNSHHISERTGIDIRIAKVADVDITTPRGVNIDRSILTTNAQDVIGDKSVSVIVEAIGGTEPALKFVISAIENGKHVVTSNKELIAKHGDKIFSAAEKKGVRVQFEAAVGGGIPIMNQLRTSLSANVISEIFGIVNGTTNYILSKMTSEGVEFASALKEAQELGFAEADPKSDIEGYDASYKAAILASNAFGVRIKWEDVYFEGISKISQEDIGYAHEMGYVIKLLAVCRSIKNGIEARVHPSLINKKHPLASVDDAYNAIYARGDAVGEVMFYGKGAGSLPTASAVVSDVIEIASMQDKSFYPVFKDAKLLDIKESESRFYIRLKVKDMPGVLAEIAGIFGENNVSIKNAIQKETVDNAATLVIITHKVRENNVFSSLEMISKLPNVFQVGNIIRVGME